MLPFGIPSYVTLRKLLKGITSPTQIRSDQIRSVAQSCPTLCDPMNRSTPGLPVHHRLPEFTEDSIHGHHPMVNTEIRLIIFFAAKDGEALYSQQKHDQELTVAQTMNSLLPTELLQSNYSQLL